MQPSDERNRIQPYVGRGICRSSIAHTQEAVDAFWNWFGSSSAVDESSRRPTLAFHGTADDFGVFDHSHAGKASEAGDTTQAFWFSKWPERANAAAKDAAIMKNDRNELRYEEGANVMPVFLRMIRPKIYPGLVPDPEKAAKQIARARANGHDSVVWLLGERMRVGCSGPLYAVFEPSGIKSAIGNPGTYDALSDHMTDGHEPTLTLEQDTPRRRLTR